MQPMTKFEKFLYKKYTKEFDKKSAEIDFASDEMFFLEQTLFFKYFGKKKRRGETEKITGERENLAARMFELDRKKKDSILDLKKINRYKLWQKKTFEDAERLEGELTKMGEVYSNNIFPKGDEYDR